MVNVYTLVQRAPINITLWNTNVALALLKSWTQDAETTIYAGSEATAIAINGANWTQRATTTVFLSGGSTGA
jgi:ligand-binding sensor domain-containing protein